MNEEKGWLETILAQSPSVGFLLLALLGGLVSHIRRYETLGKELTAAQHFWGAFRRVVTATLTSFIVYQMWVALAWPLAWGFVVAGIVAVFASEALDFGWDKVRAFANARVPTGDKK